METRQKESEQIAVNWINHENFSSVCRTKPEIGLALGTVVWLQPSFPDSLTHSLFHRPFALTCLGMPVYSFLWDFAIFPSLKHYFFIIYLQVDVSPFNYCLHFSQLPLQPLTIHYILNF